MQNPIKIVFLFACPTPFQSQLILELNKSDNFDIDIIFLDTLNDYPTRKKHWDSESSKDIKYLYREINQYKIVFSGLPITSIRSIKWHQFIKDKTKLVLFNEQPTPSKNLIKSILKKIFYYFYLHYLNPIAILGIGHSATKYFSNCSPKNCLVLNYPYYVDTKVDINIKEDNNKKGIYKFLFSGQLIERNNLIQLCKAMKYYIYKYGNTRPAILTIYGEGIMSKRLKKYIETNDLNEYIKIIQDRPKRWEDRLIPIQKCDCLISLPNYSGWGLTIPEALLFNKQIITCSNAESSDYYIKNGLNGIILSKFNIHHIVQAMYFASLSSVKNSSKQYIHQDLDHIGFLNLLTLLLND